MPTISELSYDLTHIPAIRRALFEHPGLAEDKDAEEWKRITESAAQAMDDELRKEIHDEMAPCAALDFLAVYAARHEAKFGSRFEF